MKRKTFYELLENPMGVFDRSHDGEPTLLHIGKGCGLNSETLHKLKPRVIVVDTFSNTNQLKKVEAYLKSINFDFRLVDSQYEIQTEAIHKKLVGELHKDQVPLVMGGSEMTVALVAKAYMALERFPKVVYFRAEALKKAKDKLSYGKFRRLAVKSKKDPYMDQETIQALADIGVPFQFLAEDDQTFQLVVGCIHPSHLSLSKEKQEVATATATA